MIFMVIDDLLSISNIYLTDLDISTQNSSSAIYICVCTRNHYKCFQTEVVSC